MQFKVPQFIEMEDKIVGPFTLKQILYLLGGAAVLAGVWMILPLSSFILISLPIIGLVLLLVFYKPQGRPFITLLSSLINYLFKPKLYLWKKDKGGKINSKQNNL